MPRLRFDQRRAQRVGMHGIEEIEAPLVAGDRPHAEPTPSSMMVAQSIIVCGVKTAADLVIIGGGCMGASTACHLAERGLSNVVLIEREAQLGTMSTGRNAGGFRHQFSNAANIELSKESIAMLADFEHRVGAQIDFWQDGYLFLLSSEASVAAFRRNVELQRAHGIDVEWLAPDQAARFAPGIASDGVLAATFCASDGIADPNGVTMGFARAAQQRGVEIVRGTEVTGITVENGRVREVLTSAGRIATPRVVNAAGPWASQIGRMASLEIPVAPERRHIFIAQPAGNGAWDDPPHRGKVPANRVMMIDFESTFYFHREGAGLLFGMGDPDEQPGYDTTVRWDFLPKVIEVAVKRLPA